MREIVAMLYLFSAVLPIIGIVRLYLLARREAAPVSAARPDEPVPKGMTSYNEVQAAMPLLVGNLVQRPRAVLLDLAFIGAGVVLATGASVWSLYL